MMKKAPPCAVFKKKSFVFALLGAFFCLNRHSVSRRSDLLPKNICDFRKTDHKVLFIRCRSYAILFKK